MQNQLEQPQLDPYLEEYSYDSMFGCAEVFTVETDDGQPLRCMYIDGGFQSATYLGENRFELPFDYCRAFDVAFERNPEPTDFLMIGGGGFSYQKHAMPRHPYAHFDVVEIDPVVIEIARKHFFVSELEEKYGERLNVFAEDGLEFLRHAEQDRYDVVINDAFAGVVLDSPLLSEEGLSLAKRTLRNGGLYLLNVVVDDDEDADEETRAQAMQELENIQNALASSFANVARNDVEDENYFGSINHIYIASDGPIATV